LLGVLVRCHVSTVTAGELARFGCSSAALGDDADDKTDKNGGVIIIGRDGP
jgi:hypothetical protein